MRITGLNPASSEPAARPLAQILWRTLESRRGNCPRIRWRDEPRWPRGTHVKLEDSPHFLDGFSVVMCAMVRGNDKFALRALEMRTPIGDYPVARVRGVSPATIAHDGVIRDSLRHWDGVNRLNKAV